MRRFIVIFLLLLLPIQVLAESLEDLRDAHHRVALLEAVEAVSMNTDTALKRSTPASPDASNSQQAVHADISDSVNSIALCLHTPKLFDLWPDYHPITFPSVYLPVLKPPRI